MKRSVSAQRGAALALLAALLTAAFAVGQDTRNPFEGWSPDAPISVNQRSFPGPAEVLEMVDNGLPSIVLTGYWPPTNEMLRQWSRNASQNPGVWVGADWEGRGYNVYAFFPEFPGGTGTNPKGDGDFEVDYQDTSADWWPLMNKVRPISIITTSRANTTKGWELEGGNITYASTGWPRWSSDYLSPFRPTPDMPIASEPPGTTYYSSQPIGAIITAVTSSGADVDPFETDVDQGRFLSNYIGYLGNWWHELNADYAEPWYCVTGGHIHVGRSTVVAEAELAMEVTIRTVIDHVDALRNKHGDLNLDDVVDGADGVLLMSVLNGPDVDAPPAGGDLLHFQRADIGRNDDVDMVDVMAMQRSVGV